MDVDSFIAEIIANPRDDALRLIFADFLEEQGDPRAEMIRLQFQLREISPFDPQRPKLRKRELKLMREHGGFGSAPGVVKVLDTHGGFVDSIEVTVARFLKLQEEIFKAAPIRELHLKAKSKKFDQVRQADVLKQLAKINLRQNDASDEELIRFVRSPNLQNLECLEIHSGEMSVSVVEALATAENLRGLKELVLYSYRFNSDVVQLLARSPVITNLEKLRIHGSQDDESLQTLANSDNFQSLRQLDVQGAFSSYGIQQLQTGSSCQKLEDLTLISYTNGRPGNRGFDVRDPLPQLRHLYVTANYSDQIVRDITENYGQLETLTLSGNAITDVGAMTLAQSPMLGTLKKLVLSSNQITPRGAEAIAESPHYRKRLKLYLRSNPFPLAAVREMKEKYGRTFGNLGTNEEWNWRYRQA